MTRRWEKATIPDYYQAGLHRPYTRMTGIETFDQYSWDLANHWMTTAEWLSWVKRRYPRKPLWNQKLGWHWPPRPQIAAGLLPMSTLKGRRLP